MANKKYQPPSPNESPNDVGDRYRKRRVKLNMRLLMPEPDEGVPLVLIEGSKASLEYLADVILAVARDTDCGWDISPTGPGSVYFRPESELGLYIHRLPCTNEKLKRGNAESRHRSVK